MARLRGWRQTKTDPIIYECDYGKPDHAIVKIEIKNIAGKEMWTTTIWKRNEKTSSTTKLSKTKSQAEWLANTFMRKHPKG